MAIRSINKRWHLERQIKTYNNQNVINMNTFKFDIMLNGRFVCTLRYKYCALFPINFEDLKKFILSKRPSLKGKDYRIAI
jgi:hypothetical protein|nr:MAG TPA: hypothetical protein [Caudoviricetes sp.]